MERGAVRSKFVTVMTRLSIEEGQRAWVSLDALAREMGIDRRRVTDYTVKAKKQGLIEALDGKYSVVPGRTLDDLNMSSGRRRIPAKTGACSSISGSDRGRELLDRVRDLTEYVKHLEGRLERAEQANRDKDDYIRRCLTTAPDPKRFRFPMEARVDG